MDFDYTEQQTAVRDLASQVFRDRVTDDFLKGFGKSGEPYDQHLWQTLAETGLLGTAIPEAQGGMGFGIVELGLILEEQGKALAPIPLAATLAMGALPIGQFGSKEQQQAWLPKVAKGQTILTAGFTEAHSRDPAQPGMTAKLDGNVWRLDGEKVCVPYALQAERILVTAKTGPDSIGVFLLDPSLAGVTTEAQATTAGEPQAIVSVTGAKVLPGDVLGDPDKGAAVLAWTWQRAATGLAGMQVGVGGEALRRTVDYVTNRVQFGRPIGSFQAVQHRAADSFVDLEAMRATYQKAAWRLSQGLPSAAEVAAAQWWACLGGQRIVHTTQHLHGGMGADVDYPIHRFFLWARQIEAALGGAALNLAKIGAELAAGTPDPLT